MKPEAVAILEARFAECQTQWWRLDDARALLVFMDEALGDAGGVEPYPSCRLDEDGRGFTLADALILETGSLVLSGRFAASRRTAFLAETHYAVVAEEELYQTLGDFLARTLPEAVGGLRERFGHQITLITGPSRTADIEKILILGAHGPRRLIIGSAPGCVLQGRFDMNGAPKESP